MFQVKVGHLLGLGGGRNIVSLELLQWSKGGSGLILLKLVAVF
jgi:hypothetical protein